MSSSPFSTSVSFIATLFIYLFIYYLWLCWVFGSCEGFLQPRQAGATPHRGAGTALHRGARAFHHRGPSRCGAQAPDAQAQQLWLTGPAAPRHVGSSETRARTRVPCTSRQTLNHCATREALHLCLYSCLTPRFIRTPFFFFWIPHICVSIRYLFFSFYLLHNV